MPIRGREPEGEKLKRFSRGDEVVVTYVTPQNERVRERMTVREVRQGRRTGKIKLEADGATLEADPGGRPNVRRGRRFAGRVEDVRPGFTGRLNVVGGIMAGSSRDELMDRARARGLDIPHRATRRDLAKLLAATDKPEDDGPGKGKGGPPDEFPGRGVDEPPGLARQRLDEVDHRPRALDEDFLFF
jgi:hypothetical protein